MYLDKLDLFLTGIKLFTAPTLALNDFLKLFEDGSSCLNEAKISGHLHNHVGLTENFDQSENEEFLVNDSP